MSCALLKPSSFSPKNLAVLLVACKQAVFRLLMKQKAGAEKISDAFCILLS